MKYPRRPSRTALLGILLLGFIALFFAHAAPADAQRRTLRIGLTTNKAPFSFVSLTSRGLTIRGAYIDAVEQIARRMHVNVQYIKCADYEMQNQLIRSGALDAMMILDMGLESTDEEFYQVPTGLDLTSWLFVNESCKTITCSNDLHGKRIAAIGWDAIRWPYDIPQDAISVYVETPYEGLKLLNDGLVEAFVAPSVHIASYTIQQEGFHNVRRMGLALRTLPLNIAIPKDNHALYHEMLDASLRTLDSGVIQQIKDKWFGVTFKQNIFQRNKRIILAGAGFCALLIILVFTWNQQLKRTVRHVTTQLRVSENRYRNLIESSPDMMIVINREGVINHMNREAHVLMPPGFEVPEPYPNLVDMLAPGDKEQLAEFLADVFSQTKVTRELRFKDPLLGYREIDIAATLLPVEPGEEQYACLFARDVTQRNRIERDLVQADRMAIIGQMAADVAHEINNPIGIVRANIDLILAREWYAPEAREFLESSRRNTIRAGEFTKDLLAMATPKTPELVELNLWDLVNATLEVLGAQLKSFNVQTQSKGEPPMVLGDWNLLQQVLVNLLLNAAAAVSNRANPEIRITCCVPRGTGMVRLRVEDKGVGIAKIHLNEIFEPFFTKGKKEGFGLGLFISRRIIENHNGIIYSESEEGRGSQFIVELPLCHAEECALPAPDESRSERHEA